MNGAELEQLLKRYLDGQSSEDEQRQIGKWLDAQQDERISTVWSEEGKAQLLTELRLRIRADRRQQRIIPIRRYVQAAAVFLVVTFASFYLWRHTISPPMEVAFSGSATRKIYLTDGSIVWLKGNSSLTYPEKFAGGERHVLLTGEGLFEVAKDTARPFVIQCGELTAKVLGTSFNIKEVHESVEVTVLTGKVNVYSSQDKSIDVMRDEKIRYSKKSRNIYKIVPAPTEVKTITAFTEYNMVFDEKPMKEVIKRVEAKFNVNVDTSGSNIENCLITADFTDQSLEITLQKMAGVFSFSYSIDQKNGVTITGGNCQ